MQTDTELVAGHELDALVAEKIMGIVVEHFPTMSGYRVREWEGGPLVLYPIPAYSTDIAAAWQVVERVWQEEWVLRRFLGSWQILDGDPLDNHRVLASAETAPLAICRAALQAVAT